MIPKSRLEQTHKFLLRVTVKIFILTAYLLCQAQTSSTKWIIRSQNATANVDRKTFTYFGSVEITTDNARITCERLEGRLNENEEIEELVATGAVHLINSDGAEVFGQKAVFSRKDRKITVTGSPRIIKDRNSLAADEVIYFIDENRFDAKGKVETVIVESPHNSR